MTTTPPRRHAAEHFKSRPLPADLLSADDYEIGAVATRIALAAEAEEGVTVVGLREYLTAERKRQRDFVRAEARRLGVEYKAAHDAAESLRKQRNDVAVRVRSWEDPEEGATDTERDASVAALIGVSRQAAAAIREQRIPAPHNTDDVRNRTSSG